MHVDWHSLFFWLVALIACWFALAVVVSNNIVRMALYLVGCLGAVAGLFFLAGADFLGGLQLMVYVGGTLVLLAFGVMLTSRSQFVSMKTGAAQWVLAVIVGGSLLFMLLNGAVSVSRWAPPDERAGDRPPQTAPTAGELGLGLVGVRPDKLDQPQERLREGMAGYLLPFEVISVHLVVVLVGAAYLARARRRVGAASRGEGEIPGNSM